MRLAVNLSPTDVRWQGSGVLWPLWLLGEQSEAELSMKASISALNAPTGPPIAVP
jgi:hypothetical protein